MCRCAAVFIDGEADVSDAENWSSDEDAEGADQDLSGLIDDATQQPGSVQPRRCVDSQPSYLSALPVASVLRRLTLSCGHPLLLLKHILTYAVCVRCMAPLCAVQGCDSLLELQAERHAGDLPQLAADAHSHAAEAAPGSLAAQGGQDWAGPCSPSMI